MPELPEVEILRKHLSSTIPGHRIRKVHLMQPGIIRPDKPLPLVKALRGQRIQKIDRFGKNLVMLLGPESGDLKVLIHLGMTGRLFHEKPLNEPVKHKHAAIVLECDKGTIYYVDSRRFGRWSMDLSTIDRLGPDLLDTKAFNATYLRKTFQARSTRTKDLLMDQSCLAGLGNIYACEVLYEARIHPLKPANTLSIRELNTLFHAILVTLKKALDVGNSSDLDWAGTGDGERFFYFGRKSAPAMGQKERFDVYGRRQKPCRRCHAPIQKILVSQRGTFYCSTCQRL
jgi:formamidopyrimidine-DNA glycosylase